MLDVRYQKRSGWSSATIAGQSVLLIEAIDPTTSLRLVSEFEKFNSFKNQFVENGGRWEQTSLINFEDGALLNGEVRLANAGKSVSELIAENPSDDQALENLLKGVLNALAHIHGAYNQAGENRGHGNVRPELIFQDSNSTQAPYVLGPILNRIPGPYQPELYPEKAFNEQIPTKSGDLYALGMIALRLRMGDIKFGEFYTEIYESGGDRDVSARWQGWHDNIFLHPKLSKIVGANDRLSNFVKRLLERNEDAQFPSARFALEELVEFTGAIKLKSDNMEMAKASNEESFEEDDLFIIPPKKKNTKLINGLLIAACGVVAASVAMFIFKPDIVTNVFGSGSGIDLQAVDDSISVNMASEDGTSCNVITGTGNCSFDDLMAKNKRNVEKLKQEMFVSAVSFGDQIKREAPFIFSTDDGFALNMSQDGTLKLNTKDMVINEDSRQTNLTVKYLLKVKNKTDEGVVNITLIPPNAKPIARIDSIKIPVDKIGEFKSFSLLKNDGDPDQLNQPRGWSFDEVLRIHSVNDTKFNGGPILLPFEGSDVKVRVSADGALEFDNVPETITDPISVSFSYNISDILGAESDNTTADITITKPDWENSNPIAQPDILNIDMAKVSLPSIFDLMADNGNGIDTDNDMSEEMTAIGIVDNLRVLNINGEVLTEASDITLSNGAKIQVIDDGTVAILSAPDNVGFGKPVSEQIIYTLADDHGGLANGVATLNFMMSSDPNYEQLNENWRIKVKGRVPNGVYQEVQSMELPSINDCRSFARNITEEKAKKLLHPDYGFLGLFWVKEFDELSVCILERGPDGLLQAKLKSDETIKTSSAAYIPEKYKEGDDE